MGVFRDCDGCCWSGKEDDHNEGCDYALDIKRPYPLYVASPLSKLPTDGIAGVETQV
jgi:hypothetical protein